MEYVIETRDLNKNFGPTRVLKDINLQVSKGSIFGLVGPNGAGKTTTIRLLMGTLKPTMGTVSVLGLDSWKQGVELRQRVGYVAEKAALYPYMQVQELMRFNAGLYKNWDWDVANRLLNQFDLPRASKIKELSKGMCTQVALTLALCCRPELLILDEPTSNLDPVWRRQFLQVLTKEVAERETTVLFSSHILSDLERVADWVGIITHGKLQAVRQLDDMKFNERKIRIVFQGSPPEDLLTRPGIKNVERQGSGFLITIEDNFDEIYSALGKVPHFLLEVVEQDLETIFLEYAEPGGGKLV
ncbi:MAG: ABC transporter ATP-binding protein [Firmicutes bacterium]|nr:ABC transporter ATP-binding protein [Bacillota bacterium]